MRRKKVLVVTGSTGSGKTEIAAALAELFRKHLDRSAEIISADSRQVYKHIPIATSQPPAKLLKKYKHHFIGELELDENFSAGEFSKRARKIISYLEQKNEIPIVAGGSGLYINALIYGLFNLDDAIGDEPETKQKLKEIRNGLYERMDNDGINSLLDELRRADPAAAGKLKFYHHRRIIRALEIFYLTGIPISEFHKKKDLPDFDAIIFGIKWDRKKLYERINARAEKMIESGLIEEVNKLRARGFDYRRYNSLNTVGIKEVFDHLNGKTNYGRMVELIKQSTRRFAKRQMTWFRKDRNIKWIEVEDEGGLIEAANDIFQHIEKNLTGFTRFCKINKMNN